ncbi:MAG: CinA family nicotinamide mononucleotide deamidase-related protein [Planctomycetota bacterium]|nr:MAG: CinA family nicotinamide mononucleotide deamidase-related protein [Planctomycetota bacterium]
MPAPRALIVSVGEELLQGRVTDANACFLAGELFRRGIEVAGLRTVGDAPGAYRRLLQQAAGEVDLVVSSGGLGPTADDRVRSEASAWLGRPLAEIDGAVEPLARLYRRQHGTEAPAWFLAQAKVPAGARPLANRAGTAWGFAAAAAGDRPADLICLPGPPGEARSCFLEGGGARFLAERFPAGDRAFVVLHTCGEPESRVEARIRDLFEGAGNPRLGITADAGKVSVSVLAEPEAGRSAAEVLAAVVTELEERLADILWGRDDQTLEEVVVGELRRRRRTVATAESCTGGRIAAALTAVPGASEVFHQGWICYADAVKTAALGVPADLLARHGAVSAEVAAAMAAGARREAGADYAVAATGIAGPGGGSPEKPVGLVFLGLAGPGGVRAIRRRQFARAGRAAVQEQTVRDALEALRREILGLPPLPGRE